MGAREKIPAWNDLPDHVKLPEPVDGRGYLAGGEIRRWAGPLEEVFSPVYCRDAASNQEAAPVLLGYSPLCTAEESQEVLNAAVKAYDNGRGEWPTMSVAGRIEHMEAFVGYMQERREEVVRLIMWEIGKSWADAGKEFDRTVKYIRDTITALKDLDRNSSRFSIEQGYIGQIRRSPLGVVLCMGPYNYPLNETFTTLIPALIMGNAVIFKPPRIGKLLYQPLLKAFQKAFPPGVVNMIAGDGPTVISPLMQSGKIDVLAFIGTSQVASHLKKLHPRPHRLRCILGLESKNPAIVLPDADLDIAVRECVQGSLYLNGQRCTAIKLIFVHASIAEKFVERLVGAVEALKVGWPWEEGVMITPLPEPGKPEFLSGLIADAREKGAQVVNHRGGEWFLSLFNPAVLYPVTEEMKIYHVEQFGPVVPVVVFNDLSEPIEHIIKSNYGQQASIFSTDPRTIGWLVDQMINQVARININSLCQRDPDTFPFTGRKDSAEGTLSVFDALRVFSIRTLVAAKSEPHNQRIISEIVKGRMSNFLSTDYIF